MLFDLQGKRKRVVQVIYLGLALLMGIGLVGLGIGGSANGGIFDALGFGGNSTSSDTNYDDEIDDANEALESNPKDQEALLNLVQYEFLEARAVGDDSTGQFQPTSDSLDHFENVTDAWERYIATKPDPVDDDRASLAYQSYGFTIDPTTQLADQDLRQRLKAAQIVADARPYFQNFVELSYNAYLLGDEKLGEQAANEALKVAGEDTQKQQVRQLLKQGPDVREQILKARKEASKAGGSGALGGEGTDDPGSVGSGGPSLTPPSSSGLTPTP